MEIILGLFLIGSGINYVKTLFQISTNEPFTDGNDYLVLHFGSIILFWLCAGIATGDFALAVFIVIFGGFLSAIPAISIVRHHNKKALQREHQIKAEIAAQEKREKDEQARLEAEAKRLSEEREKAIINTRSRAEDEAERQSIHDYVSTITQAVRVLKSDPSSSMALQTLDDELVRLSQSDRCKWSEKNVTEILLAKTMFDQLAVDDRILNLHFSEVESLANVES